MMMVKVERWVLSLGLSMRLGLSIIYQMRGLITEREHGTWIGGYLVHDWLRLTKTVLRGMAKDVLTYWQEQWAHRVGSKLMMVWLNLMGCQ